MTTGAGRQLRLAVFVYAFAVLVLAAVVVALIRVDAANERQDRADVKITTNTARIERVQYDNCIGLREQHLRQNALIDAEIARRSAMPNPDEAAIERLRQFRFDVPLCGPKPTR